MNTEKKVPDALKTSIKNCPADFKAVGNLIRRSRKDLASSKIISASDLEAAYTLLYDSMLHAGLAYMAAVGLRPDVKGKHRTVIQYMAHVLGEPYENQIHFYDQMRRRRHHLLYEPGLYQCTEKEMDEAEKTANDFLKIILERIRKENPQKDFGFF